MLHVITVFFNPAGFKSLLNNYYIFKNRIENQGAKVITIELSFNRQFEIHSDNVYRLTSNSVMWQKERLINYGISLLPDGTEYFAWIDCDILFLQDNWIELAIDKFKENDILQLTKKIYFGTKGETEFSPFFASQQGVIWQYKIHKNWLDRRKTKELSFSAPGFCFGARTEIFKDIGIYDRCITGSGDTFLIDILLGSSDIHGYSNYLTSNMIDSMNEYKTKLLDRKPRFDYIPVNILHLYHGTIANRNYLPRHEILRDNDYNPYLDIKLENNVFEWNSDKTDMHSRIEQYFFDRKEDI